MSAWRARAAIVARDWAHVGVRWPAAVMDRTQADAWASGDRIPVVLLPGIWEPWRYLRPLGERLHHAGHPVFPVPALRLNGADLAASAEVVAAFLAARDLRNVVLVAHSKGGLIGKQAMLRPEVAARVRGMVAVCSPFDGSRLARPVFARTPLGLFCPDGGVLLALAAERAVNARITSIGAAWDEMIPDGSVLPGARNITVAMPGHFLPIADPGVATLVCAEVDRFVKGDR